MLCHSEEFVFSVGALTLWETGSLYDDGLARMSESCYADRALGQQHGRVLLFWQNLE